MLIRLSNLACRPKVPCAGSKREREREGGKRKKKKKNGGQDVATIKKVMGSI